jgi:capsule polysaccharide export protein KpsE/RkpR
MKKTLANSELEVVYHPQTPLEDAGDGTTADAMTERLRLLWMERRFLFRVTVWAFVIATIVAFLIPKRYESTTRLMPPDDESKSPLMMAAALGGKLPGGLGAMAGDVLGLKSTGALFIGILTSRTVQDDLVTKFDLRKVYSASTWDLARRQLADNTSIYEDHKSGIISVVVTDHDPRRAAAMAEEYVVELNKVVNQLSTSSARRERIFLEERLAQVEHDLKAAERAFGDFASKNTAIDIKEQAKAMVGGAAVLQGELIATRSQIEGLRQIYTENNVRIRSLRARATELQAQLNKMGGQYNGVDEPSNTKDDSLYPTIRKLPVLGITFADLYRSTKVQETVFEVLTQQYELAKVTEAKETPNVKVLDPSNLPERKSFPPRFQIMMIGALSGFVLAVLWIVGHERWDKVDAEHPRKIFVRDISSGIRFYLNGPYGDFRPRSAVRTILSKFSRKSSDNRA